LDIAFLSKSLRSLCTDETKAIDELGETSAAHLKRRLADIRASDNVNDLIAGNPRTLETPNEDTYIIDIQNGLNIMFCANHNKNPNTSTGKIDWINVTRIKVIKIGVCNVY